MKLDTGVVVLVVVLLILFLLMFAQLPLA